MSSRLKNNLTTSLNKARKRSIFDPSSSFFDSIDLDMGLYFRQSRGENDANSDVHVEPEIVDMTRRMDSQAEADTSGAAPPQPQSPQPQFQPQQVQATEDLTQPAHTTNNNPDPRNLSSAEIASLLDDTDDSSDDEFIRSVNEFEASKAAHRVSAGSSFSNVDNQYESPVIADRQIIIKQRQEQAKKLAEERAQEQANKQLDIPKIVKEDFKEDLKEDFKEDLKEKEPVELLFPNNDDLNVAEQNRLTIQMLTSESDFRFSQPVEETGERSAPEIGSILSEKIALLESKITILSNKLDKHNLNVNVDDINRKLREVESRIIAFDDPDVDYTGVTSSIGHTFPAKHELDSDGDLEMLDISHDVDARVDARLGMSSGSHPNSSVQVRSEYFQSSNHPEPSESCKIDMSSMPWYRSLMSTLHIKFGLTTFRQNQAEAVAETLAGRDVVVLMPTGGGKSLCYQLPALVKGGATSGTTVVISPLISLMHDQVYHLKNRNIEAEMLNSRLSSSERTEVMSKLQNGTLKLLYISPEMLSVSSAMQSSLQTLFENRKLARIVIDEAHCVSAWGHDFRPDYMELTKIKKKFPGLPIMALTATANDRVLLDIVDCLRPNPLVLKQSFNRRNLIYEVRKKTGNVMNEIITVCRQYQGRTGIIYCLSKKNCESTANDLRAAGIKAEHYHAGMDSEERSRVQTDWQQGTCSVVCATIAFGMGIDKPDVRYVIHMSLPRNIEGYYQETGRAGRDGKLSKCILFYNFRDFQKIKSMINDDSDLAYQDREHHISLLDRVMQYCENGTDCRRKQVLQYFNEDFDTKLCGMKCDNCANTRGKAIITRDFTTEAKTIISVFSELRKHNITTQQLTDIVNGRSTSKVKSCGFDKLSNFGCARGIPLVQVERIIHSLLAKKVIEEYSKFNRSRYPQTYVHEGPNFNQIMHDKMLFKMDLLDSDVEELNEEVPITQPKRTNNKKSTYKPRGTGISGYAYNQQPGQRNEFQKSRSRSGSHKDPGAKRVRSS